MAIPLRFNARGIADACRAQFIVAHIRAIPLLRVSSAQLSEALISRLAPGLRRNCRRDQQATF
jgi:hypothetical protein